MAFARLARESDYSLIAAFDEWRRVSPSVIAAGECFIAGRAEAPEAYAVKSGMFMGEVFVSTLFVRADARRSGLGSALMAHLESICPSPRILTSTNLHNLPMQRLLQRRGYELCGVIEKLAPVPELYYMKALTGSGR